MGMHVLRVKKWLQKLSERWRTTLSVGEELNGKAIVWKIRRSMHRQFLHRKLHFADRADQKFMLEAFAAFLLGKKRMLFILAGRFQFIRQQALYRRFFRLFYKALLEGNSNSRCTGNSLPAQKCNDDAER